MALHCTFSGKKVLVTGGGQGIGRQLVQRFYDDGAIVFTIDKNPEAVAELKKSLPKITAEIVDITDWDATRKAVESFGVIDHLVNNAGVVVSQNFLDITKEAATLQFNVNLLGTVNISQVVAKGLIAAKQEGTIVNIASICAKKHLVTTTLYGATKAGVENLTKSMAVELGVHSIRVNAVSPGFVDTPIVQCHGDKLDEVMASTMERLVIHKRLIKPDEIVDLVMFLSSPLSAMIVGETMSMDGGYCLK